jgi:hypothetical protein
MATDAMAGVMLELGDMKNMVVDGEWDLRARW